jgi:hypothetical protein
MTWDLLIESDCVPVTLRAGAEVACRAGQLWMTVEHRTARPSADIVLLAGQRCRVAEDGIYFLSALRTDNGGMVQCHITPPGRHRLELRPI